MKSARLFSFYSKFQRAYLIKKGHMKDFYIQKVLYTFGVIA